MPAAVTMGEGLGWQKKKNPKTGDTANLKGYTVGSRAPPMAKNSGTTIAETGFKYLGVGPLGGRFAKSAAPTPAPKEGKSLFYHEGSFLTSSADKDCFLNRGI